MRDSSLLIAIIGAVLVSVCSSNPQSFHGSAEDEPVRMASESLVVKSYKEAESSTTATTKSHGERFEEFQIYQGVMGRPGIDFPVYPHIPATKFSCRGVKKSGYYADLETDCQVFHICDGNRKISFLCPNGTIFRQSHLICDWWFRVDCGKSVELYEESAEQLAADQKIYKARSEERERRRKLGKSASEHGGELTSSEVYALDEPFHTKIRKSEKNPSQSGERVTPPQRNTFEGRKTERHSKKVSDSGATEKFPNYNKQRVTDRTAQPFDGRQSTASPVTQTPKVSFVNPVTPATYKARYQTPNSINSQNNKENIQPAESGSLVEDLNNRNYAFRNNQQQSIEYNNRGVAYNSQKTDTNSFAGNNFAYNNNQNRKTEHQTTERFAYNNNQNVKSEQQTADRFSYNNNQNGKSEVQTTERFAYNNNQNVKLEQQTADRFAYNNNQNGKSEHQTTDTFAYKENQTTNDNRKINFNYNDKLAGRNNFGFNDKRTQQYVTSNTEEQTDIGTYTTEFFNYESKRTNPVERQETVTPTFQTTRKGQSSRYRTSATDYGEQEKQFFAETAFAGNNRGGKSYSDLQNQFQTFTTSQSPYKTTFYTTRKPVTSTTTPPPPPVNQYSTINFNQEFHRTTTHRPVKQHSKKVTIYPSTSPQTTFANRIWQTTTFQPFFETTTNDKFTVDDIYFTTSTPDTDVEFITEGQTFGVTQKQSEVFGVTQKQSEVFGVSQKQSEVFGVSQKQSEVFGVSQKQSEVFGVSQKQSEVPNEYVTPQSTSKTDVDITLRELNINKTPQPTKEINKSYEDFVREGLEVPPSSGPNAIRSFALYYATTNNNVEESKTTAYLSPEVTTTLTPFEIKKKEVVKQVDELVQRSSVNTSEHVSHSEELPNSLTLHIQNSYSELFPTGNHTVAEKTDGNPTESFETTAFESYTEEPFKINKELTKNDLDGSQSRGLVEPDPHSDTDYSKVSPDLRELAQVFTKALSAYLDDPETFRKVLSEIRPTEPTADSEVSSSNPLEYPSATQEDDEVLDFSDVTKSTHRKKTSTVSNIVRETTTEYFTEPPTTNANEIENFVLPVNQSSWATNIELTAPLFESLDQSQSSYYTPPSYIGTTNAIAEEINNEFTVSDQPQPTEADDSYFPIKGSVDDPSLPRYGGFQNNTTKYSPYGAELTSTTYLPFGGDLTPTPNTAAATVDATTFNPNNVSSFFSHFSRNDSEEGEIQLGKELNNLVLLQKFTTPRGSQETTTQEPNLSTVRLTSQNDINQYQDVKLGNGETLEKTVRGGKSIRFSETGNHFEPDAKEINLELSPPPSTPRGFLITYSVDGTSKSEPATYLPKATTPVVQATTYSPTRQTFYTFVPETQPPTFEPEFENFSERLARLTKGKTSTEHFTTVPPPTTTPFAKSTKSFERLAELQESLMFNTNNLTIQQRDAARVTVEEMIDKMNMTDSTATTLMRVMEMAAKNETYRRLVLLLVNDRSGRNKTVEETRQSLLKALLTPVINPPRTVIPIRETSKVSNPESRRRSGSRRSKSIDFDGNIAVTATSAPTRQPTGRKGKPSRGLTRAESNYKSGLGNLGVIRRTIENSKNKQVKINSIDDAILDSDSRAVELLRSLYSLAARWG